MTSLPVGSVTDRVALVRAIATQHLSERGALMPVLHDVVEELGHIAREDVEAIADVLNLSVAEVHGVVTFYKDFRTEPPAAHTVALCRGRGLPVGRAPRSCTPRRAAAPATWARTSRSTRSSASATARSVRPACSTAACTAGCRASASTR